MMPWFPGDFLRSVRGWPLTARAIYRELLDAQWDMGVLPIATAELQQIVGATSEQWAEGWARVEAKFPIIGGGRLNERLEEHRRKALSKQEKRKESGKKGGLAKAVANARANAVAKALAKPYHPSPSPSPSPSETSQSLVSGESVAKAPPASRGTRLPADFELTEKRRQYAIDRGLDPQRVFLMFTTYWRGKAGPNGVKLDWESTWQHWCLKDAEKNVTRLAPRKTRYEELSERLE